MTADVCKCGAVGSHDIATHAARQFTIFRRSAEYAAMTDANRKSWEFAAKSIQRWFEVRMGHREAPLSGMVLRAMGARVRQGP